MQRSVVKDPTAHVKQVRLVLGVVTDRDLAQAMTTIISAVDQLSFRAITIPAALGDPAVPLASASLPAHGSLLLPQAIILSRTATRELAGVVPVSVPVLPH